MAIKKQPVLTKEDFESALVTLRLSVSEVSRETGIPRHVVSHFRNYGDGLKPEQLAKLRDYFESRGIEFEHGDAQQELDATETEKQPASILSPIHPMSAMQSIHYIFPVKGNVRPDVLANALDMIGEADARMTELMKQEVKRVNGLFGNGELNKETIANLQDVFSLLAANYLVVRMLRGWPAFDAAPVVDAPQTLRGIVFDTFKQHLVDAGLVASELATAEPVEEMESA